MLFSLFVVFEGSPELGPVPICRVVDMELTKSVTAFAMNKACQTARALHLIDGDASSDASLEADKLRTILETI